jgi:hypothetical protein
MPSLLVTLTLLVSPEGYPWSQSRVRLPGVPQFACAIHAQQVAAEWVGDHQGWRVVEWRCGR